MTAATTLIALMLAMTLMVSSGLSKRRLEWRPRRVRIHIRRFLR